MARLAVYNSGSVPLSTDNLCRNTLVADVFIGLNPVKAVAQVFNKQGHPPMIDVEPRVPPIHTPTNPPVTPIRAVTIAVSIITLLIYE